MARQETEVKRFDLTNGFVTEFTELTFPENATVDESNFTIENDGSRKRRLGVDYESNYVLHGSDVWQSGDVVTAFEWRAAGGDSSENLVVVQVGKTLHFYDRNFDSFSNNKIADTIDLTTHKESSATDTEVRQNRVDGSYGRARFFVVGKFIAPFFIEWDGTNITTTSITIEERDFEGVDDGLNVDDNPGSLSSEHAYNLQNQGWPSSRIDDYFSSQGNYPSNTQIWWVGLYPDTGASGKDRWDAGQVASFSEFGNTRAPRGHFIRNVFDTTQSFSVSNRVDITSITTDWDSAGDTVTITTDVNHGFSASDPIVIEDTIIDYTVTSGAVDDDYLQGSYTVTSVVDSDTFTITKAAPSNYDSGLSVTTLGVVRETISNPAGVTTTARPVSVAFFAGRVFWSGIPDDRLGNKIYFSQIIEFEDQIGKCYQQADPTAQHDSDLVDSDGGVITVSEMGQVLKMTTVGKNLVLFADNGIWNVGPGEQGFFTATSFSIRKISRVSVSSPESVIMAEGTPIFWADQGIYALGEDQVSGFLGAQSITVETIQTFYRDIPDESKNQAFGEYDDISKKFYWAYSSDSSSPEKFDRCLIFDAKQQAFQKFDFKSITNGPFVAALMTTLGFDEPDNKLKLFSIQESDGNFTWSNFNESSFHDWKTFDGTGVDADGFLVTGYELGNDAGRDKQTPVVSFLFKRTETGTNANGELLNPGSCKMQARWDWSNSSNSNKWNPERQIYRLRRNFFTGSHPSADFDDGYPVVRSRQAVRGRGNAFNMKLRTEEDHDLHLLGWQMTLSGGSET